MASAADPGPGQLPGQPVRAVLGADEEQRARRAAGQLGRHGQLLLLVGHDQHPVFGQAGRFRLRRHRVQGGVAEIAGDQLADPAVQGGREQHPLPAGWGGVQDPGHGGHEPEVGHVVSLVQHRDLDLAQRAGVLVHQVDQPARGGHHQVDAVPQAADLPRVGHAAVHGHHRHAEGPAQRPEHVGDLLGQLAGRHQHQAPRCLDPRTPGPAVDGQPGQQRQAEGQGLAGSGLGPAEYVPARQRVRQRPALDRERNLDVPLGQRLDQPPGQTQFIEGLHFGLWPRRRLRQRLVELGVRFGLGRPGRPR